MEVGEAKRLLSDYQQRLEGLTQGLQTVYGMGTAQLENFSRLQHPNEWEKYGDEVKSIIEQRKQTKVVSPEDYEEAIEVVKGRHFSDYVDARAQEMLQTAPTTEGVGPGGNLNMNEPDTRQIPENYKAILDRAGLTMRDLEQHIATRRAKYGDNVTVEKWLQMAANDDVVWDGRKLVSTDLTAKKDKPSG
jgi:hypothetical protein